MKRKHRTTYSHIDWLLASPTEPMPANKRQHQLTRMYAGLRALETADKPTDDDWFVCSDAVNIMEALVDMRIVEDSSGLIEDAIAALGGAAARERSHGVLRMDAKGIQAVRAVLEDYAEVIEHVSARTMIEAHRLTEKRMFEIIEGRGRAGDVNLGAVK